MVAARRTANEIVCDAFRELLTTGFYAIDADGVVLEGEEHAFALLTTKPWRGELWKQFRALEDRLCPVRAFERASR